MMVRPVRAGVLMGVGFWLGVVAFSNGFDLYDRCLRAWRRAQARRAGYRW